MVGRPRKRVLIPGMGTRFVSVSKRSIAALGLTTSLIQWLLRVPSSKVRRPEHETDHSPPSVAGVRNE